MQNGKDAPSFFWKKLLFFAIQRKINEDSSIKKVIDGNVILGNIYDKNNNTAINNCIKINIGKIKHLNQNKLKTEIDMNFFVQENCMEDVLDSVNNIFDEKWINLGQCEQYNVDIFLKKTSVKVDGKRNFVGFLYQCYAVIDNDVVDEKKS